MLNLLRTLLAGLRLNLLLRPVPRLTPGNPGWFFALVLIALSTRFAIDWLVTPAPHVFNPADLLAVLSDCVLTLAAAWVISVCVQRQLFIWSIATLLLAATVVLNIAINFPLVYFAESLFDPKNRVAGIAIYTGLQLWWLLVLLRFTAFLSASSARLRWLAAAFLGFAVSALPWRFLPDEPVWRVASTQTDANSNALLDNQPGPDAGTGKEPDFDAEDVMYAQPRRMQQAIATLAPQTPGKVNLYLVAFAGDGEENVFRNEAEFVERQFSQRFAAAGHTLTLINNPATVEQRPIASITNLETAIDAIADKMNPDEDILLLFLTSHGSRDHELYVSLDPLPLDQIAPDDLADVFAKTRIRWKVIVISACYSGGFIGALQNSTTMVITAARADRSSFGCGSDSDITDFGKAFFAEGLNHHDTFSAAFAEATQLIDAWETRDGEQHSYPQMATTPLIEEKLKAWRAGIRLGPAVPFMPVMPAQHTDDNIFTAAAFSAKSARIN